MRAVIETVFDIFYLVTVLTVGTVSYTHLTLPTIA